MPVLLMTVRLAFRMLRRNPLRATLTMLGIIIGVGAVVAMVSLGQGAAASVQAQITSLGTNLLIVIPGATTISGVRTGSGGVSTLTVEDAHEIEHRIPNITHVSYATRAVLQVVHENKNWSTIVLGTTSVFRDIRDWALAEGTYFTLSDEVNAAKVAVLGKTAADNLFDRGEPIIGSQIRIKNVPLRVVGVLEPKGQSLQGQDQDDVIQLPFSTAERKVFGTPFLDTVGIIFGTTVPTARFAEVVRDIRELLRARHHLRPGQDDDFTIRTMEDIAKASMTASRTMMVMLLSIASISLLVGGIGIMNILLVSVTERTREIGIRMAIGAKRRHVLLQFLVESLVMTTIGGLVGVIVGALSARMLTLAVGWPAILSPFAAFIAFAFSAAVGILFGLYPANKASSLQPIEALKYE